MKCLLALSLLAGLLGRPAIAQPVSAVYQAVREAGGSPDDAVALSHAVIQEARLTAADLASDDNFGWSVSLSADRALIGAWQDDDQGTESGSAYVFVLSGGAWVQEAKLVPTDGAASGYFGATVSLSGNRAAVGASVDDPRGTDVGAAYVFVRAGGTWT